MNKIKQITSTKYYPWIVFTMRILIGIMWIAAGYSKLTGSYSELLANINGYDLFSQTVVMFIANTMPITEIILGILTIIGVFIKTIGKLSIFLLVLFIIGLSQALFRGLSIDCGCFGTSDKAGTPLDLIIAIIRDVVFIIMISIYVWYNGEHKLSLQKIFYKT